MDVSIIIVAWNVRDFLHDCLESIYQETKGIDFEVIYVDNASEDGSAKMVRKDFPRVVIIQNTQNKGFVGANNQGIEVAKGRYVLLLNSDTVILHNAIAKAVEFADAHPEAGTVGCKILTPDGTLQRHCFMYPSVLNMFLYATFLYKIFPKSKFFGRVRMTWWNFDDVREVETISGCFSLARREAIKQVGLMDDVYFMYGDDIDWCYRFKKMGWKIMFTPDAEIIHRNGQTTKLKPSKFMLQLYGSTLIFMKLHRSRLAFQLARVLTALFFLLRVPYWLGVAMFCKNERKKAIQSAKTYLKGGFYSLADWKRLLMNKEAINRRL